MQPLAKSEMQSCVRLVGVLVAVVVLASPTAGRPNGAPTGACVHMTPGHGSTMSMDTLPYTIEVNTTTYQPNGALKGKEPTVPEMSPLLCQLVYRCMFYLTS